MGYSSTITIAKTLMNNKRMNEDFKFDIIRMIFFTTPYLIVRIDDFSDAILKFWLFLFNYQLSRLILRVFPDPNRPCSFTLISNFYIFSVKFAQKILFKFLWKACARIIDDM